jgi:hypothetical protein
MPVAGALIDDKSAPLSDGEATKAPKSIHRRDGQQEADSAFLQHFQQMQNQQHLYERYTGKPAPAGEAWLPYSTGDG